MSSFGYCLWLVSCYNWRVEWLPHRPLIKKSRILLSGPLQKRFANFCLHWYSLGFWADVSLTHAEAFRDLEHVFFPPGLSFPLSWNILSKCSSLHSWPRFWRGLGRNKDGVGRAAGGGSERWVPELLGFLGCLRLGGVWWMMLIWLLQWYFTTVTLELHQVFVL